MNLTVKGVEIEYSNGYFNTYKKKFEMPVATTSEYLSFEVSNNEFVKIRLDGTLIHQGRYENLISVGYY